MGIPNKILKSAGIKLPEKYQWLGSALLAVALLAVAALILFTVMALLSSSEARAEENGWLTASRIYLDLDHAKELQTSFCKRSTNDLTSNLGADVTIYKHGALEWHIHTAHHSCAFGPDAPTYDAVGAGFTLKFERHGWFWDSSDERSH